MVILIAWCSWNLRTTLLAPVHDATTMANSRSNASLAVAKLFLQMALTFAPQESVLADGRHTAFVARVSVDVTLAHGRAAAFFASHLLVIARERYFLLNGRHS